MLHEVGNSVGVDAVEGKMLAATARNSVEVRGKQRKARDSGAAQINVSSAAQKF